MIERVNSSYEHALQHCYYEIGNRGIRVDPERIATASAIVESEISRNLAICSNQWGCIVFVGKENAPEEIDEDDPDYDSIDAIGPGGGAVNLNATQGQFALLKKLKDLGYNVPKITKKNDEGEYEQHYSAGELAIQKMLSENQFNFPGGDPALRAILSARELGKLKTSYLNARLYPRGEDFFFLSNYNVAGTLTGRRSSKRHTFGYGNNGQNFPKHSKIAHLFRKALVARRGCIFLFVDQIQAEDWPVSALSGNVSALQELRSGVDRHSKLASSIWNTYIPPKNSPDWDEAIHDQKRYIGKKGRHANNYGMLAPRFQEVLIQEAQLAMSLAACKQILSNIDLADPSVKAVFHRYVAETLSSTRMLITPEPFLRERQFLELRPTDNNSSKIKEAYAYIPQSTVGDNTGFSLLKLETSLKGRESQIVQEGHDSIVQDVVDTPEAVYETLVRTEKAFKRKIRFPHNGIEIEIPIEGEVGYDFKDTVKIKDFSLNGVREAMQKLRAKIQKPDNIFSMV